MKTINLARVKSGLGPLVDDARNGPLVIQRDGKTVAALIAVSSEAELKSLLKATRPRLGDILERGYQQIRDGHGIPPDEFFKYLDQLPPTVKKAPNGKARRKSKK